MMLTCLCSRVNLRNVEQREEEAPTTTDEDDEEDGDDGGKTRKLMPMFPVFIPSIILSILQFIHSFCSMLWGLLPSLSFLFQSGRIYPSSSGGPAAISLIIDIILETFYVSFLHSLSSSSCIMIILIWCSSFWLPLFWWKRDSISSNSSPPWLHPILPLFITKYLPAKNEQLKTISNFTNWRGSAAALLSSDTKYSKQKMN